MNTDGGLLGRPWERRHTGGGQISMMALLVTLAIGVTGCLQTKMTEPARSASEQLLLSTAADRAFENTSFPELQQRKVFVDSTYFSSYDSNYVIGTIRDVLSRSGARLVNDVKESDVVVEARSGALSIDSDESLVGLPKLGVPIPLAGTVETPEIALYKSQKQYSTAKLALLAYETHSGQHVYSSGPKVGRAYLKYYRFLGYISYTSTDIPEKQRKKRPRKPRPAESPSRLPSPHDSSGP